jgi:dihydropyrimidinase/dihydroorotase
MLYESMERLARLRRDGANVMAMIHAEDADICAYLEAKLQAEGRTDLAAWAEGRPNVACYVRSAAAGEMSRVTGCPLYIVHITTAEEVELVRRLRAEGVPIYGETVIHYLTHTMDMEERVGCWGKVIPSIKSATDREALWRGLADGTLTTLGTDHCPWTKAEKEGPGGRQFGNIWGAIPGMTGMECLLPVIWTYGVRPGRLAPEDVARITAENPARRFGLYPRKGAIQAGSDADLVVLDPDRRVTVDDSYYLGSVTDWSSYHGFEFHGMPETTIVRGSDRRTGTAARRGRRSLEHRAGRGSPHCRALRRPGRPEVRAGGEGERPGRRRADRPQLGIGREGSIADGVHYSLLPGRSGRVSASSRPPAGR